MLLQLQTLSKSTMRIIILMIITIVGICKNVKGQTYTQITAAGDLVDGNYLIVGDGGTTDGIMLNTINATPYINYTAVTNPGATISAGYTAANVFQITVSGGVITIYNASIGYASWGRAGNTGNTATYFNGTVASTEQWTPTVASGLWTLTNVFDNTRMLQWNNSSPRFACYTSTQVKLKLYKETITCTSPTTQASSFSATSITSSGMTLNWTNGNGNGRIVVVRAGGAVNTDPTSGTSYTGNAAFGSGSQIGTGNYVVYAGTGATNSVAITGLSANTTYHIAVYEYNTTGQCYNLTELIGNATTLCNDPTTQASSVNFTSVSSNAATINFTGGDGTNALVVVKSGSSVGGTPTDGTAYTANTVFGSGNTIAANEFVVYANTGSSVSITGLSANTTYHVAVFEYNSTSNCYLSTSPATGNFTTNSSTSDIVAVASSESPTVSSIVNTAGPLTSAQGTQVWQFTIRDGGASSPDADGLSTILTALTISNLNSAGLDWSTAIQSIDLFDGATNVGSLQNPSASITGSSAIFTGLNINVADNSTKTITVRLTVRCGLGTGNIEGDYFRFSISNANTTFSSSGSGKSAFGAAQSTISLNAISVVATQLNFTQQPTSTGVNLTMSPSVVVSAVDACGNTDIGFTSAVTLSSTGTLSGGGSATAAAGVATFASIIHSAVGTAYTLTATSGVLSSSLSSTFDIYAVTNFSKGDIVIVGVNSNTSACNGAVAGSDQITFLTFKDITPGTSFEITDNGYERLNAGLFGTSEGVTRFTRTTSTLIAGSFFTIQFDGSSFAPVGVAPDNNWTFTNLSCVGGNFNMNSGGDQIFVFQGITWNNGTCGANHDATFSGGSIMFAFSNNPTFPWSAANSTQRSNLYPNMDCYSMAPAAASDYSKYTGDLSATTRRTWIGRISNPANWSSFASCAAYDASPWNYLTDDSITVLTSVVTNGQWTGNTSTDWFTCSNWDDYYVPDSLTNVQIDNKANDPIIGASPAEFPTGAFCNNLLLTNTSGAAILTINNTLSDLTIKGSVTNDGIITGTNGDVEFRSGVAQTFGGTGTTTLYNIWLKNTHASSLTLNQDITYSNNFYFTNGVLNVNAANKLIATKTTVPSVYNYTNAKFINGKFRQYIATNTSTYPLPLGYSSASTDYHRANFLNGNITGVTYIDTYVNSITESGNNIDSRIVATQQSEPIVDVVNIAEWNITPNAAATGGHYGVDLYVENMGALTDDQFFVVKRDNTSTDYADWNTYDATTFVPLATNPGRITSAGAGFATRNMFTSFSKFAIGKVNNIVLAMQVVNLSAAMKNNYKVLSWSTIEEENVMYFEVERSKDGLNYTSIGTVVSNLSGRNNTYELIDELIDEGITYYKLYSVNQNGVRQYHQTISINQGDIDNGYSIVYASDAVVINFNEITEVTQVNILNAAGQQIRSFNLAQIQQGKLVLNNTEFAKGIYIIQVIQTNKVLNNKIIIY